MNLRIYYKYLSSRIASKWTVLLVDVIIVVISTLEPNIVKHQSDYQILILGIVW